MLNNLHWNIIQKPILNDWNTLEFNMRSKFHERKNDKTIKRDLNYRFVRLEASSR